MKFINQLPIENELSGCMNEVVDMNANVTPLYQNLWANLANVGLSDLTQLTIAAQKEFRNRGVNFLTKGANSYFLPVGTQEPVSIDPIPRILYHHDWEILKRGIKQRARVFNLFLHDLFAKRQTIVPEEVIRSSAFYKPEYTGWQDPDCIYVTIYGSDIVLIDRTEFIILEDNLANPAGSVYALAMRDLTKRYFPALLTNYDVLPLYEFAEALKTVHLDLCRNVENPLIVYVTRGPGGVDFYESIYLSQKTDFVLVDPEDLLIEGDGTIYLNTLDGSRKKVDLIYSHLSAYFRLTHELPKAVQTKKVRAVNLYSTFILSDKGIFPYVPEMIRHYLGQEPIIGQPKTFLLSDIKFRNHVFQNLNRFVIKRRHGWGGRNVLIGREASRKVVSDWLAQVEDNPIQFIAQEVVDFTRHVRLCEPHQTLQETASDLRVFAIMGRDTYVPTEILTRCARDNKGIVNVSSGGAIKDTWIVR